MMRRPPAARVAVAVLAVAAFLRLAFLTTDSLWLDEVFSIRLALDHSAAQIWHGRIDALHPPLFYLVLKSSLRHFGVSEWAARLPSALASLLNVGLVFCLAITIGLARRAALLAAILMAVSPLDLWFAREARMYALVGSAALLFAIGLTMRSWLGVIVAAAGLTAGLYLDYTMAPLAGALLALWIVWWWRRGGAARELVRVTIALLAAVWLSRPLWPGLVVMVHELHAITFFSHATRVTGVDIVAPAKIPALLVLLVAALGLTSAAIAARLDRPGFLRRFAWSVTVAFAAATAAFAIPRAYSAKQIIVTGWPFVTVIAAWALTAETSAVAARNRSAGRRAAVVVAISCVAVAVTLMTHRADWRGVTAYMDSHVPQPGRVIVEPAWNVIPYDYYRPADPARTMPGRADDLDVRDDVWLVAERFGGAPPTSNVEAWMNEHLRLVEVRAFARLELRHYAPVR